MTASSRSGLVMPSIAAFPRSMKCRPEPATRSLTTPVTSTSPAAAPAAMRSVDVQGETRDRSVADIDLAGMHAGRERKLELFRGVLEREGAADRP